MNCPKCGFENPPDLSYCGKCGTQIQLSKDIPITKTIETPKEELTTGSNFGDRYQIIEELGKGGMGKVYRVLDKKLNEEAALKLIKPDISSDKKIIERFKTELKLARKIGHPNVGRMYELLEHEGTHYITMEYVAGQDLKGLIRQSGQLAIGTSLSVVKQVCEGLAEAHRLGVVHRDLKPSNIMIDKEGSARIMDFGIARSLKAKGITRAGVMIGTPEYMSPEQIEAKETDQRSDIYSLGVILYEMLTGRLPFEGDTPLSIAVQHRSDTPKDPRAINAQIPEDLGLAIFKCLEKDKGDRYQTVKELQSVLDKIEQGIPTAERVAPKSTPITSKEITVKFTLKKLYIPAAVILILALIAFMVFRKPGLTIDPKRVAVAAFENQTGDENLESIGKVAAHWILQGISQFNLVEVVPFMAVTDFSHVQDKEKENLQGMDRIRELARETGAGIVVSGVFYLVDDVIRFQVSMTDARKGKLIHALDPVSGPLEEKMEVIENLRNKVMGSLAFYVDPHFGEGNVSFSKQPLYEAYCEYTMGLELFGKDYDQSIKHFERAAELDPNYMASKLYVAVAYGNQGRYEEADLILRQIKKNREQLSQIERHLLDWYAAWLEGRMDAALHSIRQAENLNPKSISINYIVVQLALGQNYPQETIKICAKIQPESYEWFFSTFWGRDWFVRLIDAHHRLGNYKQELKEINRAQKYYKNSIILLGKKARAFAAIGRTDEAKKVIESSLAITSPTSRQGEVMLAASLELRAHGNMEEAKELADQAVMWYRSLGSEEDATEDQRYNLATALYYAGDLDEALRLFNRLSTENPDNLEYIGILGAIAARRGDRKEALRISDELKNRDPLYLFGTHTYWRACIASLLGEAENAVRLLREAFSQGEWYSDDLYTNIAFEPLRNYKPFQDLIKPKG